MPSPKDIPPIASKPSNFASRKADREALEAAGEAPESTRKRSSFRAGVDEPNPALTIRHVDA